MDIVQKFRAGDKLQAIYWPDDVSVRLDECGCINLYIIMENGQMDGVAWAVAEYSDGRILKHNLALLATAELAMTTYQKDGVQNES